jgi:hypothetical protein
MSFRGPPHQGWKRCEDADHVYIEADVPGFNILLAVFPRAGALAMVLWIGAYSIVSGILLLVLGFKLRSFVKRTIEKLGHEFPAGVVTSH